MKKNISTLAKVFIVFGLLLALTAAGMVLSGRLQPVFEEDVVEEDTGFAPVFMPENVAEALAISPAEREITLLAPELNGSDVPLATPTLPPASPGKKTPESGTPTPTFGPAIPDRIVIGKIGLDAPVIEAGTRKVRVNQQIFAQYTAPNEFAAGWHPDSALLGSIGNTVLNGHHNVDGEVFGKLVDLEPGDVIFLYAGEREFAYMVVNKLILPEFGEDVTVEQRLQNARWIMRSNDERLTLVTCWPAYGNSHRLIIVATPIQMEGQSAQ